jgi:hypothetical protein
VTEFCPPETSIASPKTFKSVTTIRQNETPYQTARRFRLAEQKKNADGQRMWESYARCRASSSEAFAKREAEEKARRKDRAGI